MGRFLGKRPGTNQTNMKASEKTADELLNQLAGASWHCENFELEKMPFGYYDLMEQLNEATLRLEKAKFLLERLQQEQFTELKNRSRKAA